MEWNSWQVQKITASETEILVATFAIVLSGSLVTDMMQMQKLAKITKILYGFHIHVNHAYESTEISPMEEGMNALEASLRCLLR